jgi:membrane protease YdiL (CAAX protease family)
VYSGGPVPLGPFDPATFALNTALVAVMTIMWSWVYNNTGGSILLAVLLHSSFNASGSLIGQLIPSYPDAAVYLVNGAFVLIPLLLVVYTRGRLSYRGLSTWNAETVRGTEDPGREPL